MIKNNITKLDVFNSAILLAANGQKWHHISPPHVVFKIKLEQMNKTRHSGWWPPAVRLSRCPHSFGMMFTGVWGKLTGGSPPSSLGGDYSTGCLESRNEISRAQNGLVPIVCPLYACIIAPTQGVDGPTVSCHSADVCWAFVCQVRVPRWRVSFSHWANRV